MKNNFEIKTVTGADLQAVADIHLECFQEIGETRDSLLNYVARAQVLVRAAFHGDKIVGYTASIFRGKEVLFLSWFGVTESYRKQGVGKALYEDLRSFALREKASFIELTSRNRFRDAMHFYVDYGFEIYGLFVGRDKDIMLEMRAPLSKGPKVPEA